MKPYDIINKNKLEENRQISPTVEFLLWWKESSKWKITNPFRDAEISGKKFKQKEIFE